MDLIGRSRWESLAEAALDGGRDAPELGVRDGGWRAHSGGAPPWAASRSCLSGSSARIRSVRRRRSRLGPLVMDTQAASGSLISVNRSPWAAAEPARPPAFPRSTN